jgi:carboxylesterase type B
MQPFSVYADPNNVTSFIHTPQGQSEDCLILDVLTPSHPVSSRLPVMVQIHGGGYTQGNAQSYPGDALVNASDGNMIYVSIQYRLGIFGFLASAEIAKNGVLNAGLLDQRAALDWV